MKVTEAVKKIPYLFSDEQSYLKSAMKNYHSNIVSMHFEFCEIYEALQKCCDLCNEKSLHLSGHTVDEGHYFRLKACANHQCGWSHYYLYLPYAKNDEELAEDCEEFQSCKFLSNTETDYVNKLIKENKVIDFRNF